MDDRISLELSEARRAVFVVPLVLLAIGLGSGALIWFGLKSGLNAQGNALSARLANARAQVDAARAQVDDFASRAETLMQQVRQLQHETGELVGQIDGLKRDYAILGPKVEITGAQFSLFTNAWSGEWHSYTGRCAESTAILLDGARFQTDRLDKQEAAGVTMSNKVSDLSSRLTELITAGGEAQSLWEQVRALSNQVFELKVITDKPKIKAAD